MVVTDYNEQFLDKRGTDHLIDELKAYINSIPNGNVDLSNYVTKSELQAKLDALNINIDLSAYATKEELTQAINSIDLSAYAKKTDIPSLNGYALKTEIPSKVSQLENDSNYLSSIPGEYVTDTELNAKGYLTQHQDLSAYALKTEIPTVPSLDGYATTQYVDNAIANIPSGGNVDLSNYYTKNEVYTKAETNALIPTVTNGKDGVSPTVTVTKEGKVATITCTDVNGTTTATISDGADGQGGGSSSGGASGITYAYDTEIATGDTWIDGKPIYMKVFHIDALTKQPSGTYDKRTCFQQDKFADEIISVVPRWKRINNTETYTGNVFPLVSGAMSASSASDAVSNVNTALLQRLLWCCSFNDTNFYLIVFRGKVMYQCICDVFVKYTKLS